MKSMYLRAVLALLCAVMLSACGGGGGTMYLQGTIVGLAKDGLVLVNRSTGEKLPITNPNNTQISFTFTKLIAIDEQFNIDIDTQPPGARCTVGTSAAGVPASGAANGFNTSSAIVTCVTNPYTLGGVVKGLTTGGLVLTNGPDTIAVQPSATAGADVNFTFKTTVGDGGAYGVTVLAQPAGQACTVTNPTGNMGSSNNLTLNVVCK
jgi:hypothetical protein